MNVTQSIPEHLVGILGSVYPVLMFALGWTFFIILTFALCSNFKSCISAVVRTALSVWIVVFFCHAFLTIVQSCFGKGTSETANEAMIKVFRELGVVVQQSFYYAVEWAMFVGFITMLYNLAKEIFDYMDMAVGLCFTLIVGKVLWNVYQYSLVANDEEWEAALPIPI